MARKNQEKAIRQAAERAASAAEEEEQKAHEAPATEPQGSGVVDLSAGTKKSSGSSIVIVTEPHPTG